MSATIVGTALSRQDGGAADGIHLLWTPPHEAGYSVDGFFIQRRISQYEPRVDCYTLTADELRILHADLRLDVRLANIGVRQADCPQPPKDLPDEPHGEAPPLRCVEPGTLDGSRHPNPLVVDRVTFEVRDFQGNRAPASRLATTAACRGLDCGFGLDIRLPEPARRVEVSLAHSAQPGTVEAVNQDGSQADVATMSSRQETLKLTGAAIVRLRVTAPQDEMLLCRLCYEPARAAVNRDARPQNRRREARPALTTAAFERLAPATGSVRAATAGVVPTATHPSTACLAYSLSFGAPHDYVEIVVGVPGVLAVALRDGKAVDSRMVAAPGGMQQVTFEQRAVDQVLLYVARAASSLTVCTDLLAKPEDEEQEWGSVPFLVKGLQLPLREVNGDVASPAEEESLAASRLLAGEALDGAAFQQVAEVMNETARQAALVSPMWLSTLTRDRAQDPFVEVRSWPLSLSLLVDAPWRRMLGFGFLDSDGSVVPGEVYDYRITGHFRRRDVEEQLYGLHTVPVGTTLPAWFHVGPVLWTGFVPRQVELFPAPGSAALRATGRKGIALQPAGPGGESLSLTFPNAVTSVTLEFEPAAAHSLKYHCTTSDYFLGLTGSAFDGSVPRQARVTIDFPEPIDTLTLIGHAFLYGVRVSTSPPGADPDEVVTRSAVLYRVRYEPTPEPAPPPFLGTVNLQQPILAADPAVTVQDPPRSMGFRLFWLPPPPAGPGTLTGWPPDLGAFPPFDVLGFHLERRRVDTGDPFDEVDGEKPHGLFLGNRGSRDEPPALTPGIDLLAAFPEGSPPTPPVSLLMHVDDVLLSAAKPGPPPGSLHQYRIFSVDAIGRRSATATTGSVVRLEKRIAPPQPPGPTTPPPVGSVTPTGVRARVLQQSDPELTAADRALLGASTNAIVLEWGWGTQERAKDPLAREFRVYWQPVPPDRVEGALTGTATPIGSEWHIAASLNQAVAADAMRGRTITSGGRAFRVAGHGAGQSVTLRLAPSAVDPLAAPGTGAIVFHPVLRGDELRPGAWPERAAVVPITAGENYQYVFRDRLTLDAAHPSARVWVGVSAADDQGYVNDEVPSGRPNGGRPGNESSIAAATAQARYIGRPTFSVPPPLADVPEQVTDEPALGAVPASLNLPALLPAVSIPAGHGVMLERLPANELANLIAAGADNRIGVTLPDGVTDSYTLSNPADQAAFLAQIRSGAPGRIEGRFLMDLLIRYTAQTASLWQPALPDPAPWGNVTDTLPDAAERYFYRVRLADAARHVSQNGAIVPLIVRVASLRVPAAPEIEVLPSDDDTLGVSARVRDAFDLAWLVVFNLAIDAGAPLDERFLEKAQLLRLPNRRTLYPNDGLRLRLGDGTLLAPAASQAVSGGTLQPPDRLVDVTLAPGFNKRVGVWAVTMTRDGIPSRLTGPRTATTGPTPLVVPTLTVTAAGGLDQATWGAVTVPAQVAVERSSDDGVTWTRVSPWLPETAIGYDVPALPGTRQYRLVLRGGQGSRAIGPAVTPA